MTTQTLIPDLQKALEVNFIQEALFHLVEDREVYKKLLVVNHHNSYLSLSNEDYYVFVLHIISQQIVEEVTEASNYIFNRKKILVQLETCEDIPGFEYHFCIKVMAIILQAEKKRNPKTKPLPPNSKRNFRNHTCHFERSREALSLRAALRNEP